VVSHAGHQVAEFASVAFGQRLEETAAHDLDVAGQDLGDTIPTASVTSTIVARWSRVSTPRVMRPAFSRRPA
jgi:hypothetical protein